MLKCAATGTAPQLGDRWRLYPNPPDTWGWEGTSAEVGA